MLNRLHLHGLHHLRLLSRLHLLHGLHLLDWLYLGLLHRLHHRLLHHGLLHHGLLNHGLLVVLLLTHHSILGGEFVRLLALNHDRGAVCLFSVTTLLHAAADEHDNAHQAKGGEDYPQPGQLSIVKT